MAPQCKPEPAVPPRRVRRVASATASGPGRTSATSREPPEAGLGVLLVFVTAALVMVGAVVVAGVVDRMWVLVPVMCVDLVATFAVLASVAWLLGGDGDSR